MELESSEDSLTHMSITDAGLHLESCPGYPRVALLCDCLDFLTAWCLGSQGSIQREKDKRSVSPFRI